MSAVASPAASAISPANPLYRSRKRVNVFMLGISGLALVFGLAWLVWILGTLFYEGGYALARAALYFEMTPPPGGDGGLANAIAGGAGLPDLEDDPVGDLPGRAHRDRHRHPPRGCAHQRRDGPAAVHRAQQPVLVARPERAHGQPADGDLPVRHEPVQGLAPARVGRRRADHADRAGAQHPGAQPVPKKGLKRWKPTNPLPGPSCR